MKWYHELIDAMIRRNIEVKVRPRLDPEADPYLYIPVNKSQYIFVRRQTWGQYEIAYQYKQRGTPINGSGVKMIDTVQELIRTIVEKRDNYLNPFYE